MCPIWRGLSYGRAAYQSQFVYAMPYRPIYSFVKFESPPYLLYLIFTPGSHVTRPQVIQKPGLDGKPLSSLDQPLTQEGVSDLIDRSVDRLLEVDSPSLETMKMQVAFDSSYIAEEERMAISYKRRNVRLREMQRTIATMRPKDGTDFDALTALHRQVRRGDPVVSRLVC